MQIHRIFVAKSSSMDANSQKSHSKKILPLMQINERIEAETLIQ
jgi:hypothetical protein